ncbi:MAG: hypothetical protein IJZ79_02555 [Bacilli bacterium]|nr:hypothetical protein [Bacilli bacterium]MBQ8218607.1 hypothetical protein [Bacilli bacterium]
MKKKFSMLFIATLMLVSMLTACSDKVENTPTSTVNPGHMDSLPEGSYTIDISELCSGAGEANAMGWIPTNVYMDTVQTQYNQTQDENLRLVLANAETPIASAYLFLGMKFSDDTVTYAYEATETNTDDIIIVYVEIASSGSSNITTGTLEDKDMILLGVDNSSENESIKDGSADSSSIIDKDPYKDYNVKQEDSKEYPDSNEPLSSLDKLPVGGVAEVIDQ